MANANVIHTQDWNLTGSTGLTSTNFLRGDGTWADPIGILPAYSNVVFVAKNGDDTTALAAFTAAGNKGVLAYPFLTLAAARSAAVSLTPSATNRILIKVFPGLYIERIFLATYVDWDLDNAIISYATNDAFYTVDDYNTSTLVFDAVDSAIFGGNISRSTAGTGGAVRTGNSSTVLRMFNAGAIQSTVGNTVVCTNGTMILNVIDNITCSFNGGTAIVHTAGTMTVNVLGQTGIVSSGTTAPGVSCAAGTLDVHANKITSTGVGVSCTGGTTNINLFDGVSTTAGHGIAISAGTLNINALGATGITHSSSANLSGVHSTGGTTTVRASGINVTSTFSSLTGAVYNVAGTVNIYSNITATGTIGVNTDSSATSAGITNIFGDITSDYVAIQQEGTSAARLNIYNSNITNTSATNSAIITATNADNEGYFNIYNSVITSPDNITIDCNTTSNVRLTLTNCRIGTTHANGTPIDVSPGTLILSNCTLIAAGTGKSLGDGCTAILATPCGGNIALGTAVTKGCSLTISSDIV